MADAWYSNQPYLGTRTTKDVIAWKVKYRGRKSASMWNVDLRGGTFGTDYLARAEGAMQGLFVHDAEECVYFHTYHDGHGQPLDGARQYEIRFGPEQVPPTDDLGFWSITGYDSAFTLIDHPAARYAVQSSDPGLVVDDDGGLTISVGPDAPAQVRNWVGTAPGDGFRLNFRVYLPRPEMISHDTVEQFLPPVLPVEGPPTAG